MLFVAVLAGLAVNVAIIVWSYRRRDVYPAVTPVAYDPTMSDDPTVPDPLEPDAPPDPDADPE